MEKQTVFIKVKINESHIGLKGVFVIDVDGGRKWGDLERSFHNTIAVRFNGGVQSMAVKYILEEIELPSEDEMKAELTHPVNISKNVSTLLRDMYEHGLNRAYNFILNKLKGETK